MNELTKFEIAKIIGTRATQLSQGAIPQIDITGLDNSYDIAMQEFKQNKIPFIIKRRYPRDKIVEIGPNK